MITEGVSHHLGSCLCQSLEGYLILYSTRGFGIAENGTLSQNQFDRSPVTTISLRQKVTKALE